MKISIAGAGWHGSTLAYRIASGDYVDEVVMVDTVEGKPQGLALDMMHSRAIDGFRTRIVGTNRYADTAGSAVCVVAAGARRAAGMSRGDLLDENAKVVERRRPASSSRAPRMPCCSWPPTRSTRWLPWPRRRPVCRIVG